MLHYSLLLLEEGISNTDPTGGKATAAVAPAAPISQTHPAVGNDGDDKEPVVVGLECCASAGSDARRRHNNKSTHRGCVSEYYW
jgi:hypothetical protein